MGPAVKRTEGPDPHVGVRPFVLWWFPPRGILVGVVVIFPPRTKGPLARGPSRSDPYPAGPHPSH
ncbi:hypothetical protein ACFFX0_05715 [Citricoccus parietis]|uniref:Uncharacterized protein n=1 Tax=Citricoccus parietis TaxID=592307 RepID=A0ABV5FVN2_9MICC